MNTKRLETTVQSMPPSSALALYPRAQSGKSLWGPIKSREMIWAGEPPTTGLFFLMNL